MNSNHGQQSGTMPLSLGFRVHRFGGVHHTDGELRHL
jgi:hypothetical protein